MSDRVQLITVKYSLVRAAALFLTILTFCIPAFCESDDFDESLASSLKIEANHNINRLKNYKSESTNNKIFDNEREKSLADFLEDQEKWDLIRERGLRDYRKTKRAVTYKEGTSEHAAYLKELAESSRNYEKSRRTHVNTRNQIISQQKNTNSTALLESQELELNKKRPRYTLRKRDNNKWVTSSDKKSNSSSNYTQNPTNDYPAPPNDFPAPPVPFEGFDDLPAPPPIYEGNANNGVPYDPNFNGDYAIPPPPPPPPDYDF